MEPQGNNRQHDALDALLRRYLVEQDKSGLLEASADGMLAGPPKVTPTAEREADMMRRLKQRFPEKPQTTIVKAGWTLRHTLILAGAAMVLITLGLLWLDPLGGQHTTRKNNALDGNGTAGKVQDIENPYQIGVKEIISLQDGNGNTLAEETYSLDGFGENGNPSQRVHSPWMRPSASHAPQPHATDSRSVSPNIHPPLAPAAPGSTALEHLDPFPLRGLYAQTSTLSRFYLLEPDKDHLIRGRKGTLLYIPRQAFVDAASGEAATELVQVEVKEVYNRSDFLKSNLPTVSNGRQLVSGGVVLIDAVAAGRRLALARGKEIYIEMATEPGLDISDMDITAGATNERGEMNWGPAAASPTRMVSLDLDHLYFDEFYCDCSGEKLWNNLLWALTDRAYANTWIATREFRQRLHALAELNYYSLGLMAYRDNVDKDLHKADKIVAGMIRELAAQGQAKEEDIRRFEEFAREGLTQVDPFDDHGVDLSKPDARRQLLYRKVSREETERLIRLDRIRREHAEEIASRLVIADNGTGTYVVRVKPGQRKGSPKRGIKGFNVRQLGWLNLSRPAAREFATLRDKDLKVRLTGDVPYESTRTFLLYTDLLSIVPGSLTTGQLFRFKDIPKGLDAKIVAIGFKDGMPYLGIEPLPREAGEQIITVGMTRLQIDDYLSALAALD